jgi:hypothetical protein
MSCLTDSSASFETIEIVETTEIVGRAAIIPGRPQVSISRKGVFFAVKTPLAFPNSVRLSAIAAKLDITPLRAPELGLPAGTPWKNN